LAVSLSEAVMSELLRRVPLFADVPVTELEAVVRASRPLSKKKGARVFEEGSPADCCLVLTSGRARVVLSGKADTEITLGILEPFTIVGELGVLEHSTRSASLIALEDCQYIRISGESFHALRKNAAFEDKLLAHIASTLRNANDQLRAIYTFRAVDRVVWCLVRVARQRGRQDGAGVIIRPRPLHHELADMTGCSRETVSRALMRLKHKKCVTWDDHSLRLDVEALKRHFRSGRALADVTEITRLV
jgi:CRP/FNR family transcriptional regulator, cyclic AMP receptor protein